VKYGHRPSEEDEKGVFKMLAELLVFSPEFPSKTVRLQVFRHDPHSSRSKIAHLHPRTPGEHPQIQHPHVNVMVSKVESG